MKIVGRFAIGGKLINLSGELNKIVNMYFIEIHSQVRSLWKDFE